MACRLFFNSYVFTQVITIPTFSRIIDSAGDDQGLSVACDSTGSVYVSGYYTGTPVVSTQIGGTLDILPTSSGVAVFVCKFDSTGTYQYSRIVDSAGTDSGQGVTCDSSGNMYIAGYYTGTPTIKDQTGTSLGTLPASTSSAVFVSKFNSSGTYQYSRIIDSAGFDAGQGVACDSSGNMYVSGRYSGTPTIKDQANTTLASLPASSADAAFFSKFNSSGTYQYSRIVDSTGSEIGYSVTCDTSGNVYLAGYYVTGTPTVKDQTGASLTAAVAPLVSTLPAPSSETVFVSKFDSTGTYQYSRVIDGTGAERGFSVACDTSGNMYIAGNYNGTPTVKNQGGTSLTAAIAPLVSTLPASTGEAAFVCKFNSSGTYQYSRTVDGSGNEFAWGVACDSSDNMYLTGQYNGTPAVKNQGNGTLATLTAPTSYGAFFIKFNSSGTFQNNVFVDASSDDRGYGIACDSSGNVYLTGYYNGTSASVKDQSGTSMGVLPSTAGNSAFLVKLDSSYDYSPAAQTYTTFSRVIDGSSTDIGYGVTTDSSGNVYITGEYSGTPSIKDQTGTTITTLIASSGVAAFVSKFNSSGTYQFTRLVDSTTTTDRGYSVACDSSGNLYIAGQYSGTSNVKDGDSGSVLDTLPASSGSFSAFVCKFDAGGTLQYSRIIDSTGSDTGYSVACDSSGNMYIAGNYTGTPTIEDQDGNTLGSLPASASTAAFVCKFDSGGTLQYSRIIDSAGSDTGYGVTCDSSGNMYIAGEYSGTPTIKDQTGSSLTAAVAPLVATLPISSGVAAFVSKFDSTGTYQYSRIIDSGGADTGYGVTCDSSGNVYISGEYNGTPTIKNQGGTSLGTLPASSSIAGFACKFDSTGTYQYSRIIDGTGFEVGFSMACDSANNMYLAGSYQGTPTIKNQSGTSLGTFPTDAGTRAAFLSKFDSSGTYKYTRTVDTAGEDRTRSVACDTTDNVYIAGQYLGTPTIKNQIGASMGTLPVSTTNAGAFLVKFNSDGAYFV